MSADQVVGYGFIAAAAIATLVCLAAVIVGGRKRRPTPPAEPVAEWEPPFPAAGMRFVPLNTADDIMRAAALWGVDPEELAATLDAARAWVEEVHQARHDADVCAEIERQEGWA